MPDPNETPDPAVHATTGLGTSDAERFLEADKQLKANAEQITQAERMRREAAEAEQATEMLGPQTFVNGDYVYVYDFDAVDIEPLLLAKSVFEFANNQLRNPARSLHEYEATGQMEYLATGLSYLLRRKNTDGTLAPFDRKGPDGRVATLAFIKKLPSKEYDKLVRCKENFFLKANIVDYALLMQSMPLIETFAGQIPNGSDSKSLEKPLSTNPASTNKESLSDN